MWEEKFGFVFRGEEEVGIGGLLKSVRGVGSVWV